MPYNIAKLQQQIALIRRYLNKRMHSPLSLIGQALSQLVKGCEIAILSAVLLTSKNKKLYMENQR